MLIPRSHPVKPTTSKLLIVTFAVVSILIARPALDDNVYPLPSNVISLSNVKIVFNSIFCNNSTVSPAFACATAFANDV